MSKRLRASMRAANKGRNLRPRTSQVPPETPSVAGATDEVIETRAPASAPLTAPSPDRARETVREPSLERDEPDTNEDDAEEASPIALVGKPTSTPPPSDTQPSSPAMVLPAEVKEAKSTPPPVQPAAESFKAEEPPAKAEEAKVEQPKAKAEEPKVEAKAEEPKVEAKAEEPKVEQPRAKAEEPKVEQPKAKAEEPKAKAEAPKVEQPKAKAEAPKVEQPKAKAEEPKAKAEAPKVEQPKAKAEEPKKGAPASAAKPAASSKPAQEPASASKKGEQTKKGGSKADEPGSRRPGSLHGVRDGAGKGGLDDDLDASGISAEFFRKDVDSLPPVEEHEPELESMAAPVLSPSTLARRARLRRLVAGVVSFAGVISIAVIGKTLTTTRRPAPAPIPAVVTEAKVETHVAKDEAKPVEPAKVAATEPAKAPVEPKADDKKADEAAAKADDKKADDKKADDKKADEAVAKGDDKKADDKKADEKKDEAKPTGDVKALKKEAERLLNRGANKDAAAKAREALALDPADADLYLYLGSALQSSGKWKEGVEAYCDCVRNATKGQINECRAMGGHK